MKEIWRDVIGFDGLYQVSNMGRVKSLNYKQTGKERVLKPWVNTKGYLIVDLFKDGKRKTCKVHRLVAQTFIENSGNKPQVDHVSTDKTDNRACNLSWVTPKENSNNPLTKEHCKGNQNAIRRKVFCENTLYDSIKQCAEHYGVDRNTMNHWLTGARKMPADFQTKGLSYYIEE